MIWLKRLLYLIIAGAVLLFLVALPVAGSFLITNSRFRFPERGPHLPNEVGLDVEPIEFRTEDGMTLMGWWNAGQGGSPIIIFVHGLNRSRLELLERAAEANRRGYGVLLFDLRNHGESSRAYTTLGIHETRDVCAASNAVRTKAPGRQQLLWGVSMGASTALLSLGKCKGFDGVVADSAFLSFRDTVGHHLRLYFRIPSFPVANLINLITGLRMGMDLDDGDVEAALQHAGNVPILFIAGGADRRMPPNVAKRLFDAAQSPQKRLLVIPGAGHGEAFSVDKKQYLNEVFSLFAIIRRDYGNDDKDSSHTPSK